MAAPQHRVVVTARLEWKIANPPTVPTAAITAYRPEYGAGDLFSVVVKFADVGDGLCLRFAEISALVEEMEERLPSVGGKLVLTAGVKTVADAEVVFVQRAWEEPL